MVLSGALEICEKHWKKLTKAVPPEYWYKANENIYSKLFVHVDPRPYLHDILLLQNVIHERGGCPICYVGEELLRDAVHQTENDMKADKEYQEKNK